MVRERGGASQKEWALVFPHEDVTGYCHVGARHFFFFFVFVEDDRALRPVVGFGCTACSLLLFREAEPYLAVSVNTLATAAQWQLMVT